ncbi:MAG: helix-turn-helix domain-containing protein [Betaproteobacteria bacterium]|nr:helix-turn-helix domain-containing protein [Betaproteobacteria bacterium]
MIKNERQYRITKAQLATFEEAFVVLSKQPSENLHPVIRQAQIDAANSQIADLQAEVREYEALIQTRPTVIEADSLDELPTAVIRARIALGLTQKDLAERMGLKEQQVQRYEATNYGSASLLRVQDVVKALGVTITERIFLPPQTVPDEVLPHACIRNAIDPLNALQESLNEIAPLIDNPLQLERFVKGIPHLVQSLLHKSLLMSTNTIWPVIRNSTQMFASDNTCRWEFDLGSNIGRVSVTAFLTEKEILVEPRIHGNLIEYRMYFINELARAVIEWPSSDVIGVTIGNRRRKLSFKSNSDWTALKPVILKMSDESVSKEAK